MVVKLGILGRVSTLVDERLGQRDSDAERRAVRVVPSQNETPADPDDDFQYWWAVGVGM